MLDVVPERRKRARETEREQRERERERETAEVAMNSSLPSAPQWKEEKGREIVSESEREREREREREKGGKKSKL